MRTETKGKFNVIVIFFLLYEHIAFNNLYK